MGGLDCIAGLSSKDSLDNSMFVGRRELEEMATIMERLSIEPNTME